MIHCTIKKCCLSAEGMFSGNVIAIRFSGFFGGNWPTFLASQLIPDLMVSSFVVVLPSTPCELTCLIIQGWFSASFVAVRFLLDPFATIGERSPAPPPRSRPTILGTANTTMAPFDGIGHTSLVVWPHRTIERRASAQHRSCARARPRTASRTTSRHLVRSTSGRDAICNAGRARGIGQERLPPPQNRRLRSASSRVVGLGQGRHSPAARRRGAPASHARASAMRPSEVVGAGSPRRLRSSAKQGTAARRPLSTTILLREELPTLPAEIGDDVKVGARHPSERGRVERCCRFFTSRSAPDSRLSQKASLARGCTARPPGRPCG